MREIVKEDKYIEDKLINGLVVRHLCLPDNYLDTKLVLKWIKENLGVNTIISIMSQFTPYYLSKTHNILSRKLKTNEYEKIVNLVYSMGFNNGFLQELESADECYVPDFEEEF